METSGEVLEVVWAIVGLLGVAAATLALVKRIRIPFTVALVLVGIGISQLGRLGGPFLEPVLRLDIPPGVAFFVFLPTLVFESAYKLDSKALRENLGPILTVAVPGLLLSTVIIAGILVFATDFGWVPALLLGSILSATDPVAVISLLKQLGAPKRLTVLVEGESLFNDAAAIVASKMLLGILLGGAVTTSVLVGGATDLLVVFFGGLLVGWGSALVFGMILGRVEGDSFIEISLIAVLAYFTFLFAEETLELSGVMATLMAGIMIGGWGKTKVSPEIADYMEDLFGYLAMVATALIFLMVGLRVDLGALWASLPYLVWVVPAMLASRAVVAFGLVPLYGFLPGTDPVDRRSRVVMWWGGLRGGMALAITLSLPPFPGRDLFVALVMGAVLFTLLVQGLSIEWVMRRFQLHIPPLSDRLARIEGLLSAKRRTLQQVPELQEGGLFTPRIAEGVRERCVEAVREMRGELEELRNRELNLEEERRLLYLRCFGEEKTLYYQMFTRGHLSESAYRNLIHSVELQTEAIRHEGRLPEFTLHPPTGDRLEDVVYRILDRLPWMHRVVEGLRASRTARDYEVAWARSRGSGRVLDGLDELARAESTRSEVVEEVRAFYQFWHESARSRMDLTAEQFPEFVASTQERLADRMVLHAEREAIEEKEHSGIIPEGVAAKMLEEMAEELRELRASRVGKLRVDPEELLRKVPFFDDTDPEEFQAVARRLRRRTAPAGEVIVRQGAKGDSLFLLARGVVRVVRQEGGESRDLATLMAGDFFGEMALLHGARRTATCRAVTPCALYELRRDDLEAVRGAAPGIRDALEEADRRRRAEMRHGATGESAPESAEEAGEEAGIAGGGASVADAGGSGADGGGSGADG